MFLRGFKLLFLPLFFLLALQGCPATQSGGGGDDPPPIPPGPSPQAFLADAVFKNVFYEKAFDKNPLFQLIAGIGNTSDKNSLRDVLRTVRDAGENRRLMIPYLTQDGYTLIVIDPVSCQVVYVDPQERAIDSQDETTLKQHYNTIATCSSMPFSERFTDMQKHQITTKDDGVVSLANALAFVDALKEPGSDYLQATSLQDNFFTFEIGDKQIEFENLSASAEDFIRTHTFPALYYVTKVPNGTFPVRNSYQTTQFIDSGEEILSSVVQPPAVINSSFPDFKLIPTNKRFSVDKSSFPYQAYYQAQHQRDPHWATQPPVNAFAGTIKNTANTCKNNPQYPALNPNKRVLGYALRGDKRSFNDASLTSGGFSSNAQYTVSLYTASSTLLFYAKQSTNFNYSIASIDTWLECGLNACDYTQDIQASTKFNPAFSTFSPTPIPSWSWNPWRMSFDASNYASSNQYLIPFNNGYNGNNRIAQGTNVPGLQNSFYEFTALNPYIHSVSPLAKAMNSLTKSPVIARGFTMSLGFGGIPTPGTGNGYVYIVLTRGGFELPSFSHAAAGFRRLDPWDCNGLHRYNYEQQEIVAAGSIPYNDIVAYVQVQNDKFTGPIYVQDTLAFEDPKAYERIVYVLQNQSPFNN